MSYPHNHDDYIEPRYRLELCKQSFFPSSLSVWKILPITIRQIEKLNLFRKIKTNDWPEVPRCYCSGERNYSVYHARIRI